MFLEMIANTAGGRRRNNGPERTGEVHHAAPSVSVSGADLRRSLCRDRFCGNGVRLRMRNRMFRGCRRVEKVLLPEQTGTVPTAGFRRSALSQVIYGMIIMFVIMASRM